MRARKVEGLARTPVFDALAEMPNCPDPRGVYQARAGSDDWQSAVALGVLVTARHVIDDANALVDEAVSVARMNGVTWAAIGKALKITQQAASARFGQKVGR